MVSLLPNPRTPLAVINVGEELAKLSYISVYGKNLILFQHVSVVARHTYFVSLTGFKAEAPVCASFSVYDVTSDLQCACRCSRHRACDWFSVQAVTTATGSCYLHSGSYNKCRPPDNVTMAYHIRQCGSQLADAQPATEVLSTSVQQQFSLSKKG